MTDISREAVELAARWLHVQHGMFDEGNLILALRAALDAAEARERQAVEWADAREACIKAASDFVSAEELRYHIDRLSRAEWALFAAIRTEAKP